LWTVETAERYLHSIREALEPCRNRHLVSPQTSRPCSVRTYPTGPPTVIRVNLSGYLRSGDQRKPRIRPM
jgi:hypothetical protein